MGIIQFRTEPRTACPGWRPVHPHVRGDSPCVGMLQTFRAGSPPRAWGQPGHSTVSPPVIRFTPTCVGTALPWCGVPSPIPVHPHVRGQPLTMRSGALTKGFTPTCVGTACWWRSWCRTPRVHPHVRGDSRLRRPAMIRRVGSPPRAWGQPLPLERVANPNGFTPTCVGTARTARRRALVITVHPHVRGDSGRFHGLPFCGIGSPPRAWGQQVGEHPQGEFRRFTPTCVGTAPPQACPAA